MRAIPLVPERSHQYLMFSVQIEGRQWTVLLWRMPILSQIRYLTESVVPKAWGPLSLYPYVGEKGTPYVAAPSELTLLAQVASQFERWRWAIGDSRLSRTGLDWLRDNWRYADMECSDRLFESAREAEQDAISLIIARWKHSPVVC